MEDKITKQKIEKYFHITAKAFAIARKSIAKTKTKQAQEIITMVDCYLKDSHYFKEKKDYVNCFASINYAHGWLDCGARLKIFAVVDDRLFTI
ncbi:MAG: DUF357 domain-containing protein [Nanoarchaeota archaeon]